MTQTADFGLAHALMDAHCAEAARPRPAAQAVIDAGGLQAQAADAPGIVNIAAELPADTGVSTPVSHIRIGVAVIAGISLIAALYLARAFFIPLLIGILASYALHPIV